MLKLHELKPYNKSTRRKKVVGRGVGSGHGTFSGRGAKGQKARSGGSIPVGFEGGRMPLQRQLPKKRGFKSRIPKAVILNLKDLVKQYKSGETVNPRTLVNKGLVKSAGAKIKILSDGDYKLKLNFEKVLLSVSAREVIEKAGGKIIS